MFRDTQDTEEAEQDKDKEDYILSFNTDQQMAYKAVKLFLAAIGLVLGERGANPPIDLKEVHRLFPAFGKIVGLPEWSLDVVNGKCRAVSIYFRDDLPQKEKSFWIITPMLYYHQSREKIEAHPEKEKIIAAAREACKLWLPDWKW